MIENSIAIDKFSKKVTKGVIISIFKSGDKDELGNWHPILFLNVAHKIYTKTFQLHLQPMLMGDQHWPIHIPPLEVHITQCRFDT